MKETLSFTTGPGDTGKRLDLFLAEQCDDLSRTRLKALIENEKVRINGTVCTSPKNILSEDLSITVTIPPPEDGIPKPENIPLDILYEDSDLIVLNKPPGLVVHPGAGNPDGTLVNALLYHCGDSLSGIGGVKRPGIVHRLDRDTSGVMLAAKNDKAHQGLSAQLSDRSLSRQYQALVWGAPVLKKGTVDAPIGRHPAQRTKMSVTRKTGRSARTYYEVQEKFGAQTAALLSCQLESGRTHQIRVHMEHEGYPVIGDPLYGLQETKMRSLLKKGRYEEEAAEQILSFPRQALHAQTIKFIHPGTGKEIEIKAAMPQDMAGLLGVLRGALN